MVKKEWLKIAVPVAAGFLLGVFLISLLYQCRKREVGQYQIFEVQYPNENTLLIDTKTGRTWEYVPDILESEESDTEGTVIGYYFHEVTVEGIRLTGEYLGIRKENARRAAAR
jgi:hypothetical protein